MQRWKTSKAHFWEEAPFFRLLLPLMAAIACYEYNRLPGINLPLLLWPLSACVVVNACLSFSRSSSTLIPIARVLLIHSCVFLLGWTICIVNDIRHNPLWFGRSLLRAEAFQVKVLEAPVERENTWRLKVAVLHALEPGGIYACSGKALLYVYKDREPLQVRQNDIILLPNKWLPIKNPGNPCEFDYAAFCSRNNLHYQQFISPGEIMVLRRPEDHPTLVLRIHDWGMRTLTTYIRDSAARGLLQAMLLGDEANFDDDLRQSYTDTGIIHIVAISGSHVMVFFQFIALLLFWLKNKRYEFLKYCIAVPFICFYVAVAGAPTSAIRAAVMFSVLALGLVLQKDRQPVNQLLATAFFMLLYEPKWLFAIGFQLSFMAVLSLILFYRPVYRLYAPSGFIIKNLWQGVAASIAAEILIAPIVIYYFHLFPVSFLIANVFAYIFMSVILVSGLLLIILGKLTLVAKMITALIMWLVPVFNTIVQYLRQMNPDSFRHLHLSLPELILVYAIIAAMALFMIKKTPGYLTAGLTGICLLLSFLICDTWKTLHQRKFIVYNINHSCYAELIEGDHYISVLEEAEAGESRKKSYAAREMHIASHAWRQKKRAEADIISIRHNQLLILREAPVADANVRIPVDYLLVGYPVSGFNVEQLRQLFPFKKLVLTGNQKRYIAGQWRDSCLKHGIPAHITLFDGAFMLE